MQRFFRIVSLIIIILFVVSCNFVVKRGELLGNWKISEITPEEGWEIMHIDKLRLNFHGDSLVLTHGGTQSVFAYHIVDNKLWLNETMPYGTIVDMGTNSMTIDLNKSKYSFVFIKVN